MRNNLVVDDLIDSNYSDATKLAFDGLQAAHSGLASFISESHFVRQAVRDGMSDSTKYIITGVLLLVSFLLLSWVHSIKVEIDPDTPELAKSADSSASASADLSPSASRAEYQRKSRAGDIYTKKKSEILFISYGRVKDHTLLATCSAVDESLTKSLQGDATNILQLAKKKKGEEKWKADSKDKLENKKRECRIVYVLDEKAEFIAILMMQTNFPEDKAFTALFTLLAAAKHHAQDAHTCQKFGLDLMLNAQMNDLLSGSGTPSNKTNKLTVTGGAQGTAGVLNKMDDVKQSIRSTVAAVQENDQALGNLQQNTKRMENAAHTFTETSKVARWKHQMEAYKWYFTIGIPIFDFVAIWLVWNVM